MPHTRRNLYTAFLNHPKCLPYRMDFNEWHMVNLTIKQAMTVENYIKDTENIQEYWSFLQDPGNGYFFFFKDEFDMISFKLYT